MSRHCIGIIDAVRTVQAGGHRSDIKARGKPGRIFNHQGMALHRGRISGQCSDLFSQFSGNIRYCLITTAVHCQQGIDLVDPVFRVAHGNGIGIVTGMNMGVPGNRHDVDDILALVAVDVGCALVGRFDNEMVVPAAQFYV